VVGATDYAARYFAATLQRAPEAPGRLSPPEASRRVYLDSTFRQREVAEATP